MRTISFVNMKGGVGKTTLAINVADCLTRMYQKKVAIIDVDPQFNATQCLFSGEEYVHVLKSAQDTILTVFDTEARAMVSSVTGATPVQPKELEDVKLIPKHGLHVLPGNIELYRLEMVAGEGREFSLKRFSEAVLEPQGFDYVIYDTPPTPSMWMTSALIASDYFLIPVKPDPLSMIGIDLLRSIIERKRKAYGLTLKCLGVVFTMVERSDSVLHAEARTNLLGNSFWKDHVFSAYLPKRALLAKNQLEQPFILKIDDYELRNSLKSIVENILEKVGDE